MKSAVGVPGGPTHELFTGSVPFSAADFSTLGLKHAKESPSAPTLLNMLLPGHIEEAILKALAKRQDARHGSIKDFITVLGTASIFQARLLTISAAPRTALPAISSSRSPAPLTNITDTSQEIKQQAVIENDRHEGPANTVTKKDEVSEQDTVISPTIEVSQPQNVSQEQVTLPLVVVVNAQADLVTGTSTNLTKTTPPITWSKIGRSHRSGNQGSRYFWIAVTTSSIVIAAIIIAISAFAFPPVFSPKTATRVTSQTSPGASSKVPSPVSPATPSPQPSPRPTPTPKSTPTPLPTAKPTLSPTPTSTPAPGLIVTPSQFNAATDCTHHAHWYNCTALLSVPQTYQSNVAWSASSNGLGQSSISPSAGELSPGQEQQVVIQVHDNCPITGSLIFSGGGSTVTVPWSC